ncbi:MAG TPA: hypothetical protein VE031_01945 [Chthoniobacterales bacterium]|nr:hypothetical protein [Chthoniobacterales bacterium]
MKRAISTLLCGWIALECASAGSHNELAAWVKQDCDDYRALVAQTNHARSGHEVAAAMRENVRRQRQTIKTLLKLVRSHPYLRDAAQLGPSEDGQLFWREHHPNGTALPAEIIATKKQLHDCLDAVGPQAQQQMVTVLRKYHEDAEVLSASRSLHEMWAENDRKLLEGLRQR